MKYFILYIQPLKMELIEGSEMSANHNRTPGKYPKEYIQGNVVVYVAENNVPPPSTPAIQFGFVSFLAFYQSCCYKRLDS